MSDEPIIEDALIECERLGRHYRDAEGVMEIAVRTGRLRTIMQGLLVRAMADRDAALKAAIREHDETRSELETLRREHATLVESFNREQSARVELVSEVERLRGMINSPEIVDFASAVQREAVHQRERSAAKKKTVPRALDGPKRSRDGFGGTDWLA